MQNVDTTQLKNLDKRLSEISKKHPEKKKKLHDELSGIIQEEVTAKIHQAGFSAGGKAESWQNKYVGSGGGYAAVRAKGKKDGGGVGPNSMGAKTNYLENGHNVRRVSGKAKRYQKSRAKQRRVEGRHFYAEARQSVEPKMIHAVEVFAEKLAEDLGDNG